ncbi:MAG: hypothetical protein GQF41_1546 [Candidatus Rifleibacterium amylolyticum]|nr:MAG: hypothetical protein GQF41_1546 [Candidatus Rifleibacterium amylolyticum]NLF97754.1 hypothetical protein [Candidatus Riflebacteria bacterium]
MLAIYVCLTLAGLIMMVVGPSSFFTGLTAGLWFLGKSLKVLLDILDILEIIIQIMSLLG